MRSGIGVLAGDEHGEDMQMIVSFFDVSAETISGYALQGTTAGKKLLQEALPLEASWDEGGEGSENMSACMSDDMIAAMRPVLQKHDVARSLSQVVTVSVLSVFDVLRMCRTLAHTHGS